MPNQEYRSIRIPDWLRQVEERRIISKIGSEGFVDKTIRHIIKIVEETVFNERIARQKGLLQDISPLLKTLTFLSFIFFIAIQKSFLGIIPFFVLGLALIFLSKLSMTILFKKILPLSILTALIALPATLNIIVEGREILVIHLFRSPLELFGISLPERVSITEEGLTTMFTLLMRVSCSALFVFLMTMTTRPDRFIKSIMVIIPGLFRPIIGITYRYIFFFVRRVEEFIMGLESRRIATIGPSGGRKWIASRMGLLFSISLELSRELSLALRSRGYTGENKRMSNIIGLQTQPRTRAIDISWLVFSLFFDGIILWKFLM